jgi:taurine-pyruvate aminotransferase
MTVDRPALEDHIATWDDESHRPGHEDVFVVSAEGSWITERSGRRLLDAASGHSCVNLGYANAELIEAAAESYRKLAYCSPEHRCRPVAALSDTLSAKLGGNYRLRYATTGGGAVELAVEIARRHWRHKGRPGKRAVIALDRAYHGSTGLASYASGPGILQSPHADRSPEFMHVAAGRDPAQGISRDLPTLRAILEKVVASLGPDSIAAVILEPIAFAGGVIVPPRGFLEFVSKLCRRNEILLIVDEIITGFGRSGSWFAFQRSDRVRPDVVTLGKGITSAYFPLSAAAVSEEIHETFLAPGNAMGKLITMAGHPVGCDIALKVIEIMERDDLVGRVRRNENEHLSRLLALANLSILRDVRGIGHMWGLEFGGAASTGAAAARRVADHCNEAGLLVLRADNMIRINPPLTTTGEEIQFLVDTLAASVEAVAA